jgi:hypothetical protein
VEFGGLDEGIQRCCDGGALARLRAEVVEAAEDGSPNGTLGRVVDERDARVADEARKPVSVADGVGGCVADGGCLERRQVPEPGLELGEQGGSFGKPNGATLCGVVTGALVDCIERTSPVDRTLRVGMVDRSLAEFADHVCPAPGERDAWPLPSAGRVGRERIADNRALLLTDEVHERSSALVVTDSMDDDARRGEAPHLPGLATAAVESEPAGLVETHHRQGEHVLEERRVDKREPLGHGGREVPEVSVRRTTS